MRTLSGTWRIVAAPRQRIGKAWRKPWATSLHVQPDGGTLGTMLQFDDETARRLEAVYTRPDMVAQRRATRAALALRTGERVLDIGSGPGFLAAEMAEEVGTAGLVCGVDPSESMLALSRRRPAPLDLRQAHALALPFGEATFDAAVSTQVLEYVEDVPAALAEARRVLRPGGRLLVLDTDWDSIVWHTADRARMLRVLEAWNEHLADPYLPRRLPGLLARAGLALTHCSIVPILNRPYSEQTFSAGIIGLVADFVAGRPGLEDADAWAQELRQLGEDYFFSLNRYLFLADRT
jgi:arsenite methyltransferase